MIFGTGRRVGKFRLLSGLVFPLLFTCSVLAAPPPRKVVKIMDTDGDGRISRSEWLKAPGIFDKIDANHDGYIVASEIAAFRQGVQGGGTAPEETPPTVTSADSSTETRPEDGWIDVHFHVVGDEGSMKDFAAITPTVVKILNESNIRMALIMSPPRPFKSFDIDELSQIKKQDPNRFAIMGGGGKLNYLIQKYGHETTIPPEIKQKFTATAEDILAKGAVGFGEITAHHVSLNPGHGYESVPADSPLLLLLADIAAKHGVPIDFHFDPIPKDVATPSELTSPKNPPVLKENVAGFERLLEHNPKAIIVWAHCGSDPVGFYTPKLVKHLMEKHPNLDCSIRPKFRRNHPLLNPRGHFNRHWIQVIKEFPDRFVMGTDSFVITQDYSGPEGPRILASKTWVERDGVNKVLDYLDGDLAKKIGYENAIRLYHLN